VRPTIAAAWLKPDYRRSLEQAGVEIRELTPASVLPGALDGCDGVLLTGGPDVDPVEYGDLDRHPTVDVDAERDAYELALAREALRLDLPMLGICRGAQVLNVAAGGTLLQDLPSAGPSLLDHSQPEPRDRIAHDVIVSHETRLGQVLADGLDDEGRTAVNSRHHQAIKSPAPGFIVSATAPDGVIEGIERPGARFCLGVQWHPENFWRTGEFRPLFEAFIAACESD
jgi:putative glutamine amidotransferase